jgi:predicted transposase YbfD/YdcC
VVTRLTIQHHFRKLKDPRINRHKLHQLLDIIVIALCAVLCGATDWQQIEAFGKQRHDWLRRFLKLPNGIPSHDTFERVFDRIDPQAFHRCFQDWVAAIAETLKIKHIAIDGKTMRGSGSCKLGALHLVSAWATEHHLCLGQVATAAKSNEITAIPELLELLELHGAVVTIDAMGCQKAVASKVIERGGHYVLIAKDNQPTLREEIETTIGEALETDLQGVQCDQHSKRWIACEPYKRIMYSSPQAVRIEEDGNYLSPILPIPPKGFLVAMISDNDMEQCGLTLGVSHWGGDGGWIVPEDDKAEHQATGGAV